MADIDELLDEVESKYINSEGDNHIPHVSVEKSSLCIAEAHGGGAEELNAAIHSICSIPDPTATTVLQNVVHINRTPKRRCQVRFIGESASSKGLSSSVSQRRNSSYRRPRPKSSTKIFTKRFFAKPVFELSVEDLEAENARRKQKEVVERLFERQLAVVTDKTIFDERKYKRIKSDVWRHFGDVRLLMSETEAQQLNIDYHVIFVDDEEQLLCKSFVACITCFAVFIYESHSYGTSTLRSHLKSCGKPRFNRKSNKKSVRTLQQKRSPDTYENGQRDASRPAFQEQRIKFRDDCIKLQKQITIFFLSKQRPFETINNPEFQKLLQTCVKIGSTSGNVNIADILCSQKDLAEDLIYKMYNNSVAGFESDMQNVYGVSFSFEIWVDVIENASYLSMLCYYSNDEGTFKSVVLQTFEFDYENKSGNYLNNVFLDLLKDMNLHTCKRILVIDYSSNMYEAFEREQYIYCICCSVSCAVQSVIDIATTPQDDNLFILPGLVTLVDQCKLLVLHFKQQKIQHDLPNHLHSCSENCWISILKMMESISDQWDHITDILGERRELRLFNIDEELLGIVVDFLKVFRDGVEDLASTTRPTLNMVIPWWSKWKAHCLQKDDESPFLAALKSYMNAQIEAGVTKNISLFHKLATMLDPRFKELQFLTEQDQIMVRNEAEKLVKECEELISENKSYEISCSFVSDTNKCSNLYSDSQSQASSGMCSNSSYEVYNYLSECFTMCTKDMDAENRFDPLKYWVRVKNLYPYLNRVASWILSCPASALRNNERQLANWMVSVRETEFSRQDMHLCMFSKSYKNL